MTDSVPKIYQCPICKGLGKIDPPKRQLDEREAKQIMARALRDHGYSFREIMKLCGWKSPRSAVLACTERTETIG
jgi:hypothetical protein